MEKAKREANKIEKLEYEQLIEYFREYDNSIDIRDLNAQDRQKVIEILIIEFIKF